MLAMLAFELMLDLLFEDASIVVSVFPALVFVEGQGGDGLGYSVTRLPPNSKCRRIHRGGGRSEKSSR